MPAMHLPPPALMLLLLCAGLALVVWWGPAPRQTGQDVRPWAAVLGAQALHWGLAAYALPRYQLWFDVVATQLASLALVLALYAVARWRRLQLPVALYLAPLAVLVLLSGALAVQPLWREFWAGLALCAQALLLAWGVGLGWRAGEPGCGTTRAHALLWGGALGWAVLHAVQALAALWPPSALLWPLLYGGHVLALCATTLGYVLWQYEHVQRGHERWAVVDPVTAVTHQRATLQALERMWSLARRAQQPLALLHVGLDDAERAGGAPHSDGLLAAVAQRLQLRLRTHDLLGHAGPDAFWVVLPSTDVGGALVVADDMRTLFEREPLQHHGQALRLHLSIGVHGLVPVDGTRPPEAMAQAAHRAWQAARAAGGNRIEIEA